MDKETFYDTIVAPELLKLSNLCKDNGVGFVAMVQFGETAHGRTVTLPNGSSFAIRLAEAAMRAEGNVDALMMAVARHAKKSGHSSLVLEILGTPTQPPGDAPRS